MKKNTSSRIDLIAPPQASIEPLEPRLFMSAADLANHDPFGVAASFESSGAYATYLPKMAAAGVKTARLFPYWNVVEPQKGVFDFTAVDTEIKAATADHMFLSGFLGFNTPWVNSNQHTFPVNDLADWSTYVSAVVKHTKGSVSYWEVWNEPENYSSDGSPADYAKTVVSAYNAAKAGNPSSQIGLSVDSNDINYLEQAIEAGAANHFDYIAVHPYEILGTVNYGQEAEYMSIVPTIRKMLAAVDPSKVNVPIQFTEVGAPLSSTVTPAVQGADLVKAYTMGIAQGASLIDWFEAQESVFGMGLLDTAGNPNPAYTDLTSLTKELGTAPKYEGWVLLNKQDYGFVFRGATADVLVAWAPPGVTDQISFSQSVHITDPASGNTITASTVSLTNDPLLISHVPSSLVAQAKADKNQPFPWGGNYTGAQTVSITMGAQNTESGLHQLNADGTSTAVTVYGGSARSAGTGPIQYFTVDPNFLSYTQTPIQITAVVRADTANDAAGFNLKYESPNGFASIGWNSIPGNDKWYTLTWTISNDEFVGKWGYNFEFDSDTTAFSQYYIQSVTVTKLAAKPG